MNKPAFAFVFSNSSQFVPITDGGQLCTPDMVMFNSDNQVAFPGTNVSSNGSIMLAPPDEQKSATQLDTYPAAQAAITVDAKKSPTLNFAVCDGTGNYGVYSLAGVALQGGGKAGSGQFPKVDITTSGDYTTMALTDRNNDGNSYEFYVLVQNAAGQLGLIDPRIVNQNSSR
jgi:hypothetical protein